MTYFRDVDKKVLIACASTLAGLVVLAIAVAAFRDRHWYRALMATANPDLEAKSGSISYNKTLHRTTQTRRAHSGYHGKIVPPIRWSVSDASASTDDLLRKNGPNRRNSFLGKAIPQALDEDLELIDASPSLDHNWTKHLSDIAESPTSTSQSLATRSIRSSIVLPRSPDRGNLHVLETGPNTVESDATTVQGYGLASLPTAKTSSNRIERPLSIDAGLAAVARQVAGQMQRPQLRGRSISFGAQVAGPAPRGPLPPLPTYAKSAFTLSTPADDASQADRDEQSSSSSTVIVENNAAHLAITQSSQKRTSSVSYTGSPGPKARVQASGPLIGDGSEQMSAQTPITSPVGPHPGLPSAMKGSPTARQGPRQPACVRISRLAPVVLGPPAPDYADDNDDMDDIDSSLPAALQDKARTSDLDRNWSSTEIVEPEPVRFRFASAYSDPPLERLQRSVVTMQNYPVVTRSPGTLHMSREASLIEIPTLPDTILQKFIVTGAVQGDLQPVLESETTYQCSEPSRVERMQTMPSHSHLVAKSSTNLREDECPISPPFSISSPVVAPRQAGLPSAASIDSITVSAVVRHRRSIELPTWVSAAVPIPISPDQENTPPSPMHSSCRPKPLRAAGASSTSDGRVQKQHRRQVSLIGPRASPGPRLSKTISTLRRMNSDVQDTVLDANGRRYMSLGREASPFLLDTMALDSDDLIEGHGERAPANPHAVPTRTPKRRHSGRTSRSFEVWSDNKGEKGSSPRSGTSSRLAKITDDDDAFWAETDTPIAKRPIRQLWTINSIANQGRMTPGIAKNVAIFQTPRVQVTDELGRITQSDLESASSPSEDGSVGRSVPQKRYFATMRRGERLLLNKESIGKSRTKALSLYDTDGFLVR